MYWLKRKMKKVNWRLIANMNGYVLICLGLLMVLPLICSLLYKEKVVYDFLITIAICLLVGFALSRIRLDRKDYFARDGMIAVGLCWITASLFGCLPYLYHRRFPVLWIVSLRRFPVLLQPVLLSYLRLKNYQKEFFSGEALRTGSVVWESWYLS